MKNRILTKNLSEHIEKEVTIAGGVVAAGIGTAYWFYRQAKVQDQHLEIGPNGRITGRDNTPILSAAMAVLCNLSFNWSSIMERPRTKKNVPAAMITTITMPAIKRTGHAARRRSRRLVFVCMSADCWYFLLL
jgi:hypothetical protein